MLCSCLLKITSAKKDMSTYIRSGIISVSGPEGGWERRQACLTCTMHACMTRWRDIAAQGPDTPAGLQNHFNYLENKQEQRSSSPGMTSVLICSPLHPVPPPLRVLVRSSLFLLWCFCFITSLLVDRVSVGELIAVCALYALHLTSTRCKNLCWSDCKSSSGKPREDPCQQPWLLHYLADYLVLAHPCGQNVHLFIWFFFFI